MFLALLYQMGISISVSQMMSKLVVAFFQQIVGLTFVLSWVIRSPLFLLPAMANFTLSWVSHSLLYLFSLVFMPLYKTSLSDGQSRVIFPQIMSSSMVAFLQDLNNSMLMMVGFP